MQRTSWFVVVGVLCFVLLASGQRLVPKPDPVPTPQYQLVSARSSDAEEVFVIDTHRGKVWKYQAAVASKSNGVIPEAFIPVGFGVPAVGVPGNGLTDSAGEDGR